MLRRLPHIVCSLWLAITSLIPGQGWALCVSPSGHVAVEVVAVEPPLALPGAAESACREDCREEQCEACHDVTLASAERACSRRDVVAVELPATPERLEVLVEPHEAISDEPAPSPALRASASPHLVRVLRI